ncbi:transcriptional regulator [Lactobacillus paracasei subsp. paracasei]|nr:transcriptional regulator [Lacticaseibacillus paracasei]AYG24125.1 transcriptional regulator [Lacticaseibacillus paracasei]MBG1273145.1 transcriptional regulator [Lacticaseibacillus paracasei subsp. paracasei]MCT4393914.1 transcriptional regulator [Lacticaseibacillus paracasei]RDV42581.1 transcriptional regulator [Lacticaseibacillus paracasei subsp. paracasei]
MRSPAQKPACKDPERNDPNPVITFRPAYTPISDRAGSRSDCLEFNIGGA